MLVHPTVVSDTATTTLVFDVPFWLREHFESDPKNENHNKHSIPFLYLFKVVSIVLITHVFLTRYNKEDESAQLTLLYHIACVPPRVSYLMLGTRERGADDVVTRCSGTSYLICQYVFTTR